MSITSEQIPIIHQAIDNICAISKTKKRLKVVEMLRIKRSSVPLARG